MLGRAGLGQDGKDKTFLDVGRLWEKNEVRSGSLRRGIYIYGPDSWSHCLAGCANSSTLCLIIFGLCSFVIDTVLPHSSGQQSISRPHVPKPSDFRYGLTQKKGIFSTTQFDLPDATFATTILSAIAVKGSRS